jgi:hypothetical protein
MIAHHVAETILRSLRVARGIAFLGFYRHWNAIHPTGECVRRISISRIDRLKEVGDFWASLLTPGESVSAVELSLPSSAAIGSRDLDCSQGHSQRCPASVSPPQSARLKTLRRDYTWNRNAFGHSSLCD